MNKEGQRFEKKSLKVVIGKTADWAELAKDSVCFANARGGVIYIGIEDMDDLPPENQQIDPELPHKIRKRLSELTVNVATIPEIQTASNGSQYIALNILPSVSTIAATTDGKYYYRIADDCKPLPPEELMRLMTDKPAFIWETKINKSVRRTDIDLDKLKNFILDIQASDRVTHFVKNKNADELLEYYLLAEGDFLTNLGILWIGKRTDRAKLLYSPVVQFLKFDEDGNKVNKLVWDDYSLNPKELIEALWIQIPDWKEGVEVSDGIFRKFVANYEEDVVRELIANALVHRPYTTRGDIFINLFPDRLEVHNPGLFPMGVTPQNILHKSIRRNEHLAKVFYDLKLMEREGSGFDKMYEILLKNGKHIPIPTEGDDRVIVTIKRRIIKSEIISFINRINEEYQLRQRELICLGLIAQHTALSSIEFSELLSLPTQNGIRDWLGRLLDFDIVQSIGKTKGVEYFVNPQILRKAKFKGKTNLKKIEEHRLRELIFQDIQTYPMSSFSEIHQRIGAEISKKKIQKLISEMINQETIMPSGKLRWRKYSISPKSVK
jgi:ATP-dependent DNA helicase RecG